MNRFGLIGEHLSHSLSAVIHHRIFELLGMEGSYDLIEIPRDRVDGAAARLTGQGYSGWNVTIPYKTDILPQLDRISPEAAAIGAVNTVAVRSGPAGQTVLEGYNTDFTGFGEMIRAAGMEVSGRPAAVLGMGGAYRAVAAWLLDHGVSRLYSVTRRPEEARPLSCFPERQQVIGYDALADVAGGLLVNATPVGMFPHAGVSPVEPGIIERFDAAADLIYNPGETEFLRLARLAGKATVNGLVMLVAQAVAAEEIWLSQTLDQGITARIAEELSSRF